MQLIPGVRRTEVASPFSMATESDEQRTIISLVEMRRLRSKFSNIVGAAWAFVWLVLVGVAIRSGPAGARPGEWYGWLQWRSAFEVLVFPGFHVVAFLWWRVLSPDGAQLPTGPTLACLIVVAFAIGVAFWMWLVPWLFTFLRIYLWPYSRRGEKA